MTIEDTKSRPPPPKKNQTKQKWLIAINLKNTMYTQYASSKKPKNGFKPILWICCHETTEINHMMMLKARSGVY